MSQTHRGRYAAPRTVRLPKLRARAPHIPQIVRPATDRLFSLRFLVRLLTGDPAAERCTQCGFTSGTKGTCKCCPDCGNDLTCRYDCPRIAASSL